MFVGLPREDERVEILQTMIKNLKMEWSHGIADVARGCEGFSGADLESLLRRAGYAAIKRDDTIKVEDFVKAREKVSPSVGDMQKYEKLRTRWGSGA